MSYNILDGGEGRADPIAEVIEAQRPDVVALVEAEDLTVVERIARRLKMDFVHAPGNTHASVLMSRWTIRQSINHAPLRPELEKSLLQATVATPQLGNVNFGVVHLHAHGREEDEAQRERELAALLEVFRADRDSKRPHVICGDFNANAPSQQIEPARTKERTRKDWDANGGKLPRRVVQRILDAGYIDSLHAVSPDVAEITGTFSTQLPGQRVDYIFTHNIDLPRLRKAWIEQDRLATYASDHYPVGLEIA
ncbi:MAG TPA: endonuclease/exonuclease/phosphatase family protein [Tepidisphaeraceae bacterium]|nr:endonuclease/exonuclease/phosphatase family protein [Tepidisphaeraceae bacterium]